MIRHAAHQSTTNKHTQARILAGNGRHLADDQVQGAHFPGNFEIAAGTSKVNFLLQKQKNLAKRAIQKSVKQDTAVSIFVSILLHFHTELPPVDVSNGHIFKFYALQVQDTDVACPEQPGDIDEEAALDHPEN